MPEGMYQKGVVSLVGGLDLVSPRFAVTPGTLADGLNYETYGTAGYSVVEGLEPYDGHTSCFLKDWVVVTKLSGSGTFLVGEYLKVGANFFGIVVAFDGTILSYLIINPAITPRIGATVVGATLGGSWTLASIQKASDYYVDELTFLAQQKAIYEGVLPTKNSVYPFIDYAHNIIPHGLHWYRGRVFAIADSYQISFTTATLAVAPGDQICDVTGAILYATILSVTTTTGSATDGNGAGTMTVRTDVAGLNELVVGSAYVRRPNGASAYTVTSAAFTISAVQVPNSPTAQLFQGPLDDDYQTTAQINTNSQLVKSWTPVDMGWQIPFKTDNTTTGSTPATTYRGAFLTAVLANPTSNVATATTTTLTGTNTTFHPLGDASTTTAALSTVLSDGSLSTYVSVFDSTVRVSIITPSANIAGFNFSAIPLGSIITGIEVTSTTGTGNTANTNVGYTLGGAFLTTVGAISQTKNTGIVTTAGTATILGGAADLWGLSGLSTTDLYHAVTDPSFGLNLNITCNTGSTVIAKLSDVSLKVYYQTPVSHYYAHDPVSGQDLQVDLPYYNLAKGQFNPGMTTSFDGLGTMSIYNITPLDSTGGGGSVASTLFSIGSGWQLRTARDGGGNLIALFTSQMTAAQLPSRASMDAVRKRFEIITANYYANVDWVGMYGVDGVGPSWQYDGYYFYNVYTALPSTEDTPSHICYHRGYAVLGYENGQCIVSVPGSPTVFDPLQGSTLYPFGERITGLLSLNGTALGVLCESSIHALSGDILAAVASNNAVSQIISPYSGAIEYSAVDAGSPLFMDYRGVSTIDATNKYGDFENGRVSHQITPLLSTRVNDRFAYQAKGTNLLFALPIRNKNQVRYYFADGLILTCGLPAGQRSYEFTKQQYTSTADLDTMVPVAMCTGTSRSGRDVIFGTFKLLPQDDTTIATPTNSIRETLVYAVDKGTRFYLAPINHFAKLNFMPLADPNKNVIVRRIRFEILSYHYFNEYISMAADYKASTSVKRSIQIDPTGLSVRTEKDSDYLVIPVEGRGTTFSFEIGGEHIYPGHVLQAIVVYDMQGREQNGISPNQKLT